MENNLNKKVGFEELFKFSDEILSKLEKKQFNSKECLKYIRNNFQKSILNIYCHAEKLNNEQLKMIGAKGREVKLSMDSLLKNRINHPELLFKDYEKINEIIKNPDTVKFSRNKRNSILLFKKENKTYQVVIKTTITKEENFLTSFRFAEH